MMMAERYRGYLRYLGTYLYLGYYFRLPFSSFLEYNISSSAALLLLLSCCMFFSSCVTVISRGTIHLPARVSNHGNPDLFCLLDDDPSSPRLSSPSILSSNFNAVSVLVTLEQLAFATTTIYRARDDQIARYACSRFALTVTRYAFMPLINPLDMPSTSSPQPRGV